MWKTKKSILLFIKSIFHKLEKLLNIFGVQLISKKWKIKFENEIIEIFGKLGDFPNCYDWLI